MSLLAVALLGACRQRRAVADAGPDAPAEVGLATSTGQRPPLVTARWPEARTGDGLDLARLADFEGVDRLAEVAADPEAADDDRKTALKALAYVPDSTPALAALTAIAVGGDADRATVALETLAAQAGRRAHQEELEPGAWRICAGTLKAAVGGLSKERRALAMQALLGMADRGAIAKGALPPP